MAQNQTSIIAKHVKNFIQTTKMADYLQEKGFVSKGDNDAQWYRVVNGNVIHAIYFFTTSSFYLPLTLEIGYGYHPLFLPPKFPNTPVMRENEDEVFIKRFLLLGKCNRQYSEDIAVLAPKGENLLFDHVNRILAKLDMAQTPQDCYNMHKEFRMPELENHGHWLGSSYFADEIIYWEDKAFYSYCENYIDIREKVLRYALSKRPTKKYEKELEYLELLRRALLHGDRDVHMKLLKEREQKTIRLLEKHTGIRIE